MYHIGIGLEVTGDKEVKTKLTTVEKMAEKTKKKMKALDKIKARPSAKLKDNASKKIDRIKSKTDRLDNKKARIKLEAKDKASRIIGRAQKKLNGWIKTGAKKIISIGLAGTVALGGVGIGSSIRTFTNFEKGLSNVKAVTGATNAEMDTLKGTAKSLGSSTEWSAVQVTQAEELLGQAGFKVQENVSALPGLLSLASAGDLELASATDIASGTLRAFNINANKTGHVADVLALSASATNSDVTDLGETMKYVAPVSASLGISFEDTAAAAGLLSNQNIKGSQSGTILRQTMARLASPAGEAAKLIKKYGINAFDAHGNMKPLSAVIDNLNSSLGKLTSQQRADVISTIFGTESMSGVLALMNQGGQSLGDLSKRLKETNGAAKDMANTKIDNLSGQWKILKSAVEGAQIELGQRLAPYAKQFVSWLTAKMPHITDSVVKFVDYISKNTTKIKSVAKSIAGIGAASLGFSAFGKIGNTVSGIGKFTKVFKGTKVAEGTAKAASGLKKVGLLGKILPAVLNPAGLAIAATATVAGTAYVANSNLMKRSIADTTEELGPMEKLMNILNGRIHKSKAEMQGMGLVYEDFGKNISSGFKKKVEESTRSIRDFQFYLNEINLDGKIDKKENNTFDSKVKEMCDSAIKTIQSKKAEIQKGFKDIFMDDGKISGDEQTTLDYFSEKYDVQVNNERKLQEKILGVKRDAIKKHGKLLEEDIKKIKEYQDQMAQIQLESVGGNKDEHNYAKNKFKARAQGLDIKDASTLLKESAKKRDDSIVEVKAQYTTYIDKIKSELADKSKKIEPGRRKELETTLNELEKAEAGKIKAQLKLHNENLNTLYSYNPNLKGKLNKYTGAELTGKDIKSQNSLQKMREKYEGLEQITRSGNYRIYDSNSKTWRNIQAVVDKDTKEITGLYNISTGECGGYTDQLSSKVKELSRSHTDLNMNASKALNLLNEAHINSKGEICNAACEVIANLENITVAEDGATTGILNLNGTPIKITSNKDGVITNMGEIKDSVNKIPKSADIAISENGNKAKSNIDGARNAAKKINGTKATVIINTIFKKTVELVGEKASGALNFINNLFKKQNQNNGIPQKASGTNFFSGGLSTVDEKGWELSDRPVPIIGKHRGNPLTYMQRGTRILNHMQSVRDMKREVARQVNSTISKQPPQQQIQYKVTKPQQQLQVAGMGNVNLGGINVNIQDNGDVDKIVQEAMNDFGYKLKEALKNIKK